MGKFFAKGTQKVTFIPEVRIDRDLIGGPMTDEERACDCGCMDVEHGPAVDLTAYVEGPPPAGVSPGYLVVRRGNSAEVAKMAILHDGEGCMVGQIDHTTWRHAEIVDDR